MSMLQHTIDIGERGNPIVRGFNDLTNHEKFAVPEGMRRIMVNNDYDVANLNSDEMIRVYNFLSPKPPIKGFHDKTKGIAAIWRLLQQLPDAGDDQPATQGAALDVQLPVDIATNDGTPEGGQTEEGSSDMAKAKTKTVSRGKGPAKAKTEGAKTNRGGSKTAEISRLLKRKTGCTAAEVLEATGWPAVSMPAMAKACGLTLRKDKVKGERTRYFGE